MSHGQWQHLMRHGPRVRDEKRPDSTALTDSPNKHSSSRKRRAAKGKELQASVAADRQDQDSPNAGGWTG